MHYLAWKGKVFNREKGELLNEVGPFGFNAVRAKVYKDESWLDGEETIVLDYSDTSLIAHWIRDEIRTVGPGRLSGPRVLGEEEDLPLRARVRRREPAPSRVAPIAH